MEGGGEVVLRYSNDVEVVEVQMKPSCLTQSSTAALECESEQVHASLHN